MRSSISAVFLALTATTKQTLAQVYSGPKAPRVETALTLDVPTNRVSTIPDGRIFLVISRIDGSTGPEVVEYNRNTSQLTPYPNAEWNSYSPGKDPATHLVRINAQRIGPDGFLYLVDIGSPAFEQPTILPYGPKLVQINVSTNRVSRVFPMGNVTRSDSNLNDVRFHPSNGKAYLTDSGSVGLIVLDLASGIPRRVMESSSSTMGVSPVSAEGKYLRFKSGKLDFTYADQLEVSPDGVWFCFQPNCGGLSRIETKWLDEAYYNSSLVGEDVIGQYVEPFALTPSTGGSAIDAHGTICFSDVDEQRIIAVASNGTKTVLVQDPRLTWVDAMWVSGTKLWMPAAQLNRGTPFGNGQSNIMKPLHVYTVDIGVGPSPIDHA